MRFELFPFQTNAVQRLRKLLALAQGNYRLMAETQAISFTAPTGAGKTIMLASLVERVYRGYENYPAQADAIFVWLSDSPELNKQSCDKFLLNADDINNAQLVTIDDRFDQQTLDDGKIYFLNTQKLGKGSNLTRHSDFRQYTIWETLQYTCAAKPEKIYFIIDEAHRGMKDRAAQVATTIMQKFIKGSAEDNFKSVPVVIGMSATPERFDKLVEKKSLVPVQKVAVTAAEVKESGLLKDRIVVVYPDERESLSVAKDMAVLEAAADDWQSKCAHWRQYITEQGEQSFKPVFVVQVENNTAQKISATDLDDCLKKISQRTGIAFEVGEVVHTFGETADLTINGLRVPYTEPSRISGDDKIRVVFFKENLSTGWDCPRAETMMSFRRAVDATYIAQLLGRMIRTPLRRRIETDDTLNEVRLYLPHFKEDTVQKILDDFKRADGEIPAEVIGEQMGARKPVTLTAKDVKPIVAPMFKNFSSAQITAATVTPATQPTFDRAEIVNAVNETPTLELTLQGKPITPATVKPAVQSTFERAEIVNAVNETPTLELTLQGKPITPATVKPEVQPTFERAEIVRAVNAMGLKTYVVRSTRNNDHLTALFKMAHFLMMSNLSREAFDTALDEVAAFIRRHIDNLKAAGKYDALNRQAKEFKLSAQTFDAFGADVRQSVSQNLFVTTDTDIERQFRQAEALLKNAGVAHRYLTNFFCSDNLEDCKIDVIIFVVDKNCLVELERFADKKFHALQDDFRRKICNLTAAAQAEYKNIVSDADEVSELIFSLPETFSITQDIDGKEYSDHLFVDRATGTATIKLNGWEEGVLHEEQRRADFVCWIRNIGKKPWSLCMAYEDEHRAKKSFYPDLLIVRRDSDGYVVDILEPHNPKDRDNIGKARGFAEYAKKNPLAGRMQLIREKILSGQKIFMRLDMSKSAIRDRVIQASDNAALDDIFDDNAQSSRPLH